MGGSLGFTIRKADGTEHRMCRWTNATPEFINSEKFLNEDEEHFSNFMLAWNDMREDFLSGKNEHNMTMVYAPYPFLAPMDYGLVVVDYKTKTILSLQGYTSYGRLLASSVIMAIRHSDRPSEEDLECIENFESLYKAGRIKQVNGYLPEKDFEPTTVELPDFALGLDEIKGLVHASKKFKLIDGVVWSEFPIDMSPWKIIDFEESGSGVAALRKAVEDLGFIITTEEEEHWKEFAEMFKDEEEEEFENN